jgi:putative thioredoxin
VNNDVTSFQEDVITASFQNPVLVDFWAPWCGPCRTLGPILEKLAEEQVDRWSLVKINTDEHQEVSSEYGIRGIPAVKLFVDGRVVDEFTGALPEHAVRQWLDKAIPSQNRVLISDAEKLIEDGRSAEAQNILEAVLEAEPTNAQACGLLAGILGLTDPERASLLAMTAATAEPRFVQVSDAIKTVESLQKRENEIRALPDEPARADYLTAVSAVVNNEIEAALIGFIEVIKKNRYFDDDGARKAVVSLFTLLGPGHPLTRKYRREFDMWLY